MLTIEELTARRAQLVTQWRETVEAAHRLDGARQFCEQLIARLQEDAASEAALERPSLVVNPPVHPVRSEKPPEQPQSVYATGPTLVKPTTTAPDGLPVVVDEAQSA